MAISSLVNGRTNAILLQANQPHQLPINPTLGDATGWALLIAASIWIGKQVVSLLVAKEKDEADLTKTLISDLRTDRANLLEGNKTGFGEVVNAVSAQTVRTTQELQALSGLISRFSETLHIDVQRTLKSQTDIYTENYREIERIGEKLELIESKIDTLTEMSRCNTIKTDTTQH